MKTVLSAVCTSVAAIFLAGLCQPVFAQSDATLIERLRAAIKQEEPTWAIPRASQDRYTKNTVRETFEGEGFEIRVALSAYASASEAAEVLKRPVIPTSMPPSPQRTARRDYQNHNVVVNIIVDVSRNAQTVQARTMPGNDPASIVNKVAAIIDSLISADVRVDGCINELYLDPPPATPSQREAFFRDIQDGCLLRVEQAIAGGTDANERDANGVTALLRAAAAGHRQITQALLHAGANPNAKVGALGTPPIFLVFSRPSSYPSNDLQLILANQFAILDDMIAAGAGINSTNDEGRTLLLEVVRLNYDDGSMSEILKGLIERGANVLSHDRDGQTAVILAVKHTHPKVSLLTLPVLIAGGADVNTRDASGKVALEYARERADSANSEGWSKVLQLLADAGVTKL